MSKNEYDEKLIEDADLDNKGYGDIDMAEKHKDTPKTMEEEVNTIAALAIAVRINPLTKRIVRFLTKDASLINLFS